MRLLPHVIGIAKEAGAAILNYYGHSSQGKDVTSKNDASPLTAADLAAHKIIHDGLNALTPEISILSEEGDIPSYAVRQKWESYWLTDPLDGTRGFVAGSSEFTVNIALVVEHKAILGVIYAPATKVCYYAAAGSGAFKQIGSEDPVAIKSSVFDWQAYRVVLGRYLSKKNLLSIYAESSGCKSVRQLNSSLKFCLLAGGSADIYPRLGETGEWDTAAAQCILEEAGGCVVNLAGEALQYNKKDSLINPEFVALGDITAVQRALYFIKNNYL